MMNRRQLLRYGKIGVLAAFATPLSATWLRSQAQTPPKPEPSSPPANSLSVQWLGHTSFLFAGEGQRVLVNPFRTLGCTAGYRPPLVNADLVLISSRLLDEGATEELPGNPRLLFEPGAYQVGGKQIQGIRTEHDREGGRRFGMNVAWSWTQAGIKILHLGGIAAPITSEQQILMGRPDLLLLPVGGGPKAYTPAEAYEAMLKLNPKMVIPTHYLTEAADRQSCNLVALDEFLALVENAGIEKVNADTIQVTSANLPDTGRTIVVLSYPF